MAPATFRIDGTVLDRATHSGVPGARVVAWDRDVKYHSLLGVAQTDAQGHFQITFDETYFGDYGGDKLPDLYLKVFLDDRLVKSTEDQVRRNLPAGDTSLQVEVELPPVHQAAVLGGTTESGDTPPIIGPGLPPPTNGDDGPGGLPMDTDGGSTTGPTPAPAGGSMEV